jgi:RNA polymerase sigma-70 factor (ECF subfamily)
MADQAPETDLPLEVARASSKKDNQVVTCSDGSLVRRVREGERDAATALYVRYSRRLKALAKTRTGNDLRSRFDPDDIVQSVFRTFFRRVVSGSYDVPDGEELWSLLLVVTLNKTRKVAAHHRARKRDVRANESGSDFFDKLAADERESVEELRRVVDEFTESLCPFDRQVVNLRVEGYEVAEIAKLVSRSKRTVERTLQRIRLTLRDQIDA